MLARSLGLTVVIVSGICGCGAAAVSVRRPLAEVRPVSEREYVRQNLTAERMRTLGACIDFFREEHARFPRTLAEAQGGCIRTPTPESLADGWGRPFVYYWVRASVVLISFGADGTPATRSPEQDGADADFVLTDDGWFTLPSNVDL